MRTFSILYFLFSTFTLYSQNAYDLVNIGATWVVYSEDQYGIVKYEAFQIGNDTIIDDMLYNIVYSKILEPIDNNLQYEVMETSEFGLIRQEEKLVYFIKKNDYQWGLQNCLVDEEFTLYNFSLSVGDTIDYCNYNYEEDNPIQISEINTQLQYGESRKIYQYNTFDDYIVEGIGQNKGLFVQGSNLLQTADHVVRLINYCDDITECNIIVNNMNNIDVENDLQIYPIPNLGQLYIDNINLSKVERIYLIDIKGRLMGSYESSNQLDLTQYTNGLYFLRIEMLDKTSFRTKIILTK